MSNQAIETIESLINSLEMVPGVTGNVHASLTWSYGMSLLNSYARNIMINDDPNLSADQREELLKRNEARSNQLEAIVSWAASRANPQFLPNGTDMVKLSIDNPVDMQPQTTEEEITNLMDLMDIDRTQAQKAIAANAAEQAERMALQRRAVELNMAAFAKQLDYAIAMEVPEHMEIGLSDAQRICERIAMKCEKYVDQRVQRAARTFRTRVRATLAAEKRLIESVMNQADDLAIQFAAQADAAPYDQAA